ncbi:MAG: aminotransferase class V-fold PLP-dependent enzyme [Nocardioidaceae bacterium]
MRTACGHFPNSPGVGLIGTAPTKASALSFLGDGVHPHDIGTILDRDGITNRTGHHCAQPLLNRLGIAATAGASFGCYSNRDDIAALVAGLEKVQEAFR